MDLRNEIALVTGGAQEIGRSISLKLAQEHAQVIIADVDDEGGMETVELIRNRYNCDAAYFHADITDEQQVMQLFSVCKEQYPALSILVNNAGIMGPVDGIENIREQDWDFTMAVNLKGMFLCSKHAVPLMKQRGSGNIINISSVSGKRPLPMRLAYATSKMGVIGFTRTLAAEVGKFGIRVNSICPGSVIGARQKHVFEGIMKATGKTWDEVKEEKVEGAALRAYVDQEYIANLAAFLCSSDSWAITGQDINVCAGAVMY